MNDYVTEITNFEKDIHNEMKILYDKFIILFSLLIKEYNFTNPLQLYSLFSYMVDNNYIGNKNIQNKNGYYSGILEESDISGVNVIINGGVCRHKSYMLSDLINSINLKSVILSGYSLGKNYYGINDKGFTKDIERQISEIFSISTYQLAKQKPMYILNKFLKYYYNVSSEMPNHVIILTGLQNKHFIDAQQKNLYYQVNSDTSIIKNSFGKYFIVKPLQQEKTFNIEDYNSIIQMPSSNEKEDLLIIKHTLDCINSNNQLLEEFKSETKRIREEINLKFDEYQEKTMQYLKIL